MPGCARLVVSLILAAGLCSGVLAQEKPESKPQVVPAEIRFNRDVRPILSDNCYACHGPDKNHRKAELRLDTQEGLLGNGTDPGTAVPGKLEDSELWRRVSSKDPGEQMPPPKFGKTLTDAEKEILRRWIEQGAKWEGHWAFQPIERPAPPKITAEGLVRNEIDRFIARPLSEYGLPHSPEADRVTLLRRLTFDLTGLPPTPEDVDAFVNDTSPMAYETVVDRLLASPHFGERMAIWWLDLVRYADSVGYHGDQPVSVSPFRDYVIRSFNANKPFDQFTREQLAGDLLAEPTQETKIASGYNRLGMMSAEGGVQPKEYLAKYIAERVRNVSGTWLGVTLGCCECHDHKFDPFTIRDFYSMEAFFADIQERGLYSGANANGDWGPRIPVPTDAQKSQLEKLNQQIAAVKQQLDTPTDVLATAQKQWEADQNGRLAAWLDLKPSSVTSSGGATLTVQPDGSILASGTNPSADTYTLTIANPPAGLTAFRLDVLPHDSLPQKGPGRAGNGNFVLTELAVKVKPSAEAAEQAIALQNGTATHEQTSGADANPHKKWAVLDTIDRDKDGPRGGWAILDQAARANHAVFETTADTPGGEGATLTIELQHKSPHPTHAIGHFRVRATTAARPVRAGQLPEAVAAILATVADKRTSEQQTELAAHYRSIAPALEPVRKQLADLEKQKTALERDLVTALVTVSVEPRMVRTLNRGNWMDESGEVVEPAVPAVFPQPAAQPGRLNRLDLANWVVSRDNPLTARVFVNRLWKVYFGAGLSRKLDDVGAQGEWPSHPLLLDWVADRFMDSGWNMKAIVKELVMSGTYRQSSLVMPQLRDADPSNRWLARQSRFRLDAEMVRDNALEISGLLVREVGGPSVKPYQPKGYWSYLNFPAREWQDGEGSELYRRSVYTHWQRQYLHPALLAFDAPSREECTADRTRSNTPLQSLVLLNDPEYVEAARVFAQNVLQNGGNSTRDRLNWAFRKAVSRAPKDAEVTVLEDLLAASVKFYNREKQDAADLLKVGEHPVPAGVDSAELAAWTSVTRAILNLHEVITRN